MNMQQIMQQAQKMQRDLNQKKAELEAELFSGKSEWVEVEFNGKKELKKLNIIKEGTIEEEDKEILEDMIVLAIKDAFAKIEQETEKKLGQYASLSGLM